MNAHTVGLIYSCEHMPLLGGSTLILPSVCCLLTTENIFLSVMPKVRYQ